MSGRLAVSMPIIALVAGLAIVVLVCIAAWLESVALTSPRGYRQPDPQNFSFQQTPQTAAGLAFEDIEFTAPNGEAIRGWLTPAEGDSKRVALIALHGRGGDRAAILGQLRELHDLGAGVAAIDLRENGLSAGASRGTAIGIREAEDAIAAAAEMRRRGYDKIVLLGCSLGASAAILAAARDESIDAVIADSALSSFDRYVAEIADARLARVGVSARWATALWGRLVIAVTRARLGLEGFERPDDAIARIAPRPVLLIYGASDNVTPPATHGAVLTARAGAGTDLWAVEGGGHCDAAYQDPAAYSARIAALLRGIGAAD